MKNKFIYSFLVAICLSFGAFAQEKQNISVLYVGYSADKPMPENLEATSIAGGMTPVRFKAEYGKRMPAFKQLLERYFTKVTLVDPRDYNEEMSANVDVTIFDEAPTPIKARVIHNDPETGEFVSMEAAKYVSDEFNHAALFIGHTSSVIGSSLGSKLDWYCLCLDRHAHHIKTDHAIFNGPFKTSITLKDMETPSGVLGAFDGADVPKKIPMWEVDTEGYMDGNGFRVGMVARGWGFEDSPNSEIISSGVCTKQKTAVALGRHGNFFLWGFAGSPEYMTAEAKKVFANAIVYTNTHKNDQLIVRKYNERIATKTYLDELAYYTTQASYNSHVKFYEEYNKSNEKRKVAVEKMKAEGKELSQMDKIILNSKPQEAGTREAYLAKNIGRNAWSKITGIDTIAVRKYLKDNRPYFFSEPDGFYDLVVDEDAKSLHLANTDITLLDTAITLLEKGEEVEKARRILLRYTLENFTSPTAWRTWFNKNKSKLFFSEVGGFVWYINDATANPKGRPRNEKEIASLLLN